MPEAPRNSCILRLLDKVSFNDASPWLQDEGDALSRRQRSINTLHLMEGPVKIPSGCVQIDEFLGAAVPNSQKHTLSKMTILKSTGYSNLSQMNEGGVSIYIQVEVYLALEITDWKKSEKTSLIQTWSNCIIVLENDVCSEKVNKPARINGHEYLLALRSCDDADNEIPGLPGQKHIGLNNLVKNLQPLVEKGLKCVLIFGVIEDCVKDERGSAADYGRSPVIGAVRLLRAQLPSLIIACDVCLCTYTNSHHCYIPNAHGEMDVERTVNRLAEISLNYAKAGAHIIAPSDMSEGRILAIKQILHRNGFSRTVSVMSYAAKAAAGSGDGNTDRKSYQLPPGAAGLAVRTAVSINISFLKSAITSHELKLVRDADEGADIIMVKPGLIYLDVIANIRRELPNHPLAVYHVSGEYAMLKAGADAGCIDLKSAALEILLSFRRAGASIIITYLTPYLLDLDLNDVFN
ncbi:hypothetical protein ACTXT7_001174 [Hymenolepis weldensis]